MDDMDINYDDDQSMEIDDNDEEMQLEEIIWGNDSDDDAVDVSKAMISRDNQEEVQISSQYEVKSSLTQDDTNHTGWDHTFDSSSPTTLIGSPGYSGAWSMPESDETTTGSNLMNPKLLNNNWSKENHCYDEINKEDVKDSIVRRGNKEGVRSLPQDEATDRESWDNTIDSASPTTLIGSPWNLPKLDETANRGSLMYPIPLNDLMANENHYHDTTNEEAKCTATLVADDGSGVHYHDPANEEAVKSTPYLAVNDGVGEAQTSYVEDVLDDSVEVELQMDGGVLNCCTIHTMKPNEEYPEEKNADLSKLPTSPSEPTPVANSGGTFSYTDRNHEEEKFLDSVESPASTAGPTTPASKGIGRCFHTDSSFPGLGCSLADKVTYLADWYSYFDMVSSSFSKEKLQDFVFSDATAFSQAPSVVPIIVTKRNAKEIKQAASKEKHEPAGNLTSTEPGEVGTMDKNICQPSTSRKIERGMHRNKQKHGLDDLEPMVETMKHELQRGKVIQEGMTIPSKPDPQRSTMLCQPEMMRREKSSNRAWISRKESIARCSIQAKAKPKAARHERFPEPTPTANDICIVLDDSNRGMNKLIPPLVSNLEMLFDLLCSSSDERLRMSVLTSCETLKFTSNKSEIISFLKNAVQRRQRPEALSASIAGLARSFSRVKDLDWSRESYRYVYIFTNLSGFCDDANGSIRNKEMFNLRSLVRGLPLSAEILVGRWRDDNDILLESFGTTMRDHKTFAFLNVKEMASFVVRNAGLLEALFASMKKADKSDIKVSINSNDMFLNKPIGRSKFEKAHDAVTTMEATIYQYKPPSSVHDVMTNAELTLASRPCWVQVEASTAISRNMYFSRGMVHEDGKQGQYVMLKSMKVDTIHRTKAMIARELYRKQAIVSAQAIFLSREYNMFHRPEHCSKIRFLRGYVIEEAAGNGKERAFYAEHYVPGSEEFIEFCDKGGNWNESCADETLLRFAQTCFKLSGGDFMPTGLKGVSRDGIYFLKLPSLLSRTCSDLHACQCNKEYMTACRKGAKALLEKKGWKK